MLTEKYEKAEQLSAQLSQLIDEIYLIEKDSDKPDTSSELKIQEKVAGWARNILNASNRDDWGGCILCRS